MNSQAFVIIDAQPDPQAIRVCFSLPDSLEDGEVCEFFHQKQRALGAHSPHPAYLRIAGIELTVIDAQGAQTTQRLEGAEKALISQLHSALQDKQIGLVGYWSERDVCEMPVLLRWRGIVHATPAWDEGVASLNLASHFGGHSDLAPSLPQLARLAGIAGDMAASAQLAALWTRYEAFR